MRDRPKISSRLLGFSASKDRLIAEKPSQAERPPTFNGWWGKRLSLWTRFPAVCKPMVGSDIVSFANQLVTNRQPSATSPGYIFFLVSVFSSYGKRKPPRKKIARRRPSTDGRVDGCFFEEARRLKVVGWLVFLSLCQPTFNRQERSDHGRSAFMSLATDQW